jgi:hypothetical protein
VLSQPSAFILFLPIGFVYLRMTMQTPSHLSLCSPGGGSSVRDTTPMSGSPGRNACGIQTDWEVEQRVSFRTDASQSEGFPVRACSASRRCFVYRPVATNFVPSPIIIERTSSPLLSITVISLRSTMRFPLTGRCGRLSNSRPTRQYILLSIGPGGSIFVRKLSLSP